MSIGNIASSIWGPSAQSRTAAGQKPGATGPTPPTPPPATQPAAGTGPSDPFRQLSADIQAKLLQLQATGSDITNAAGQAGAASGKAMKPHHHHGGGQDPDASASLVPSGATPGTSTTAGGTPASGANPSNPTGASLFEAMRQAIQAYAASAASSSATVTAPLATL